MKKRFISVILCVAMAALLLVGCGSSSEDTTEDETSTAEAEDTSSDSEAEFDWTAYSGTTITVYFNEHNYSSAVISKLDEFEELTGITVEYTTTPESNYFDKLNTALSSRSGTPDVYMTGAYQVWEYAPAGYMEPLEDYINDSSLTASDYDFDDFIDATVEGLQWDLVNGHTVGTGSQWALPMGWELNTLAYNSTVFEEYGIDVPTTTDELYDAAVALNEFNGSGSYGIAVRGSREWATIHPGYMSLYSTWGATDFAIEDGVLVSQVNSDEAIAMTDYWVELIKAAGPSQWSTYTWYEASADLGAGQAAMLFDATSAGYFQNYEGASTESGNISWTTIPLPDGATEEDMAANIWIWALAMNADSQNKEAAWYFIQYFTSPDYMLYAGTDGASPDTPRESVMNSDEYAAVVGTADNYLESIAALTDGCAIQFTAQEYFTEATTMWAEVLQDLVVTDNYSSTEEAMNQLKEDLDDLVSDLEVAE